MNAEDLGFEYIDETDRERCHWVIFERLPNDRENLLYKIYNIDNWSEFGSIDFAENIIKVMQAEGIDYALNYFGAVSYATVQSNVHSVNLNNLCDKIKKKYKKG